MLEVTLEKWELKLLRSLGGFWKVLLLALQHTRWLLNKAADFILGEHLALELLSSGLSLRR